ncbi:MAG TPA: endonuclease/exonuclease/phosphatase family protein [Marmoricola sp.]|nr:endonuclease/exonuclease/phosphatase family protein [Marmoricola sp.]
MTMLLTLGTFNLNNLFSRWNLYLEVLGERQQVPSWLEEGAHGANEITIDVTDDAEGPRWHWRRFAGQNVYGKTPEAQQEVARRLLAGNADVWALQEVESESALHDFCDGYGLTDAGYVHRVCLPGNDPRLINVGLISRYPLGPVTSWRFLTDPADPSRPVFSRDLLQVEVRTPGEAQRLLTVFVTHLKSQLARTPAELAAATERRHSQALAISKIITRLGGAEGLGAFALLGDMNAAPDDASLSPICEAGLELPLRGAREDHPYDPRDTSQPATPAWTHRYKPSGQPAQYLLYDQIWLPPAVATSVTDAWILRRSHREGDGSDHDPALLRLELTAIPLPT